MALERKADLGGRLRPRCGDDRKRNGGQTNDPFDERQRGSGSPVEVVKHLHQVIDYPKDLGDRARDWMGAAWEKGSGQRTHWVAPFKTFPPHPIFRGVTRV